MALVLFFIASYAIGIGNIPWFYACEIFPHTARALGVSIAVSCNWLAHYVVTISFPHLQVVYIYT